MGNIELKTLLAENIMKLNSFRIIQMQCSSFIYVKYSGIFNMQQSDLMTKRSFQLGKKLNIKKYLFDASDLLNNDNFIKKCDYFYNTIFYLPNIFTPEKIAFISGKDDKTNDFTKKLASFYLNNFRVFESKKTAIDYLINDSVKDTHEIEKYPCSAIPRGSTLELKINSQLATCSLCKDTVFKYNPEQRKHPFRCMKCGAEYSIHNFNRRENCDYELSIQK